MKYLSRVADKMLQERLETFGAVLIEGPKWTGKTTSKMDWKNNHSGTTSQKRNQVTRPG